MNFGNLFVRKIILCLTIGIFFLPSIVSARVHLLDFGLPLFGFIELRLEKEKTPDFNIRLLKKFLEESDEQYFHHLHSINSLIGLMKLSEESKANELKLLAREFFKLPSKIASETRQELFDHIYLEGLLLADENEPDLKNTSDKAFEELLLSAEDVLSGLPEYDLIKGILFFQLRNRANGYFVPMKSFEDLRKAAISCPRFAQFHFVLGQAFRALGPMEANLYHAIVEYEKSASLAPTNERLQNTLLGIYMGFHEVYQAEEKKEPFWLEETVYKKILLLSPNNPYVMNNLGYLYAEYGLHKEEAQKFCQDAVNAIPNNPGFHDSLGWAAFKNGQFEKAEKELLVSISMKPDVYEPQYHLGTLYYVTKKHEKAIAYLEKAVTLKPDASEALNNYAYLLAELNKDIEKAVDMANRAIKIEPGNPSYLDTLGWAEYRSGNLKQAIITLNRAFHLAPDVSEIMAHLGRVHQDLGDFNAALDFLEKAWKADPTQANLQNDIYRVFCLKSLCSNLSEYHQFFGDKADPKHITAILFQLSNLYQAEGMFDKAIFVTKICEKLQKGELDLSKPLIDFYTLPTASGTPKPGLAQESTDMPESTSKPANEGISFPEVCKTPVALNIGPAAFKFLASRFPLFNEFNSFSISLFIRNIFSPHYGSVIQIETPDLGSRNAISAIEFYLSSIGASLIKLPPILPETKVFKSNFVGRSLWCIQSGNRLLLGFHRITKEEIISMGTSFPWHKDLACGLLLDWESARSFVPLILQPWVGQPLGPFEKILANYFWKDKKLTEVTYLAPNIPVNSVFMKTLADDLFDYKVMLLNSGLDVVNMRVEANDGCVKIQTIYKGFPQLLRQIEEYAVAPISILKNRFQKDFCILRRLLFDGTLESLGTLCPDGGPGLHLDPVSGSLICSAHKDIGVFPFIFSAAQRCLYSKTRIEGIIRILNNGAKEKKLAEGLIQRILSGYNVIPCPSGGLYQQNPEGVVVCSVHK